MKQFALYLLILPLLLHTQLDGQNNFLKRSIYFDSDKFNLDSEDSLTLSLIADSIQNYASYRLLIRGNTDADADSAYNIKLSQNRCNTVQQFLLLNGAKISNIELDWYGENKPIAENETESGKQLNRRVDIIVYKIIRKPKNPITDSVYVPTDNIEDLFALLKQEPQQYCINPTRDTVLVGEQGTILYFKANSIAVPKGIDTCVVICLTEMFRKSDMILNNITTVSNGKIIESQGMVNVEAKLNEKMLDLKKDADYLVMIPTDTIDLGLTVFNGDEAHDMLNWLVNNNAELRNFTPEMLIGCGYWLCGGFYAGCERCKYMFNKPDDFFCRCKRVDDYISGTFNKNQHYKNKSFRKCQRFLRRQERENRRINRLIKKDKFTPTSITPVDTTTPKIDYSYSRCENLIDLFKKYGVDNIAALVDAINAPMYAKYNVTNMNDLREAIKLEEIAQKEAKLRDIEFNYNNKNISFDDLQYYIYNQDRFGWSNLDKFTTIKDPVNLKVDIKPGIDTEVRLVFTETRSIIPPTPKDRYVVFEKIPGNVKCTLIVIKYIDGKAFLAFQDLITANEKIEVDLKEYSLDALQEKLKELDKQ